MSIAAAIMEPVAEFVTRPYFVSTARFVRVASEQWFRRWWFIYAFYIALGVGALVFAQDPVWVFVGIAALLWPVTVPLRMFRAHLMKKDRGQEMQVAIDDQTARFLKAQNGKGKDRVPLSKILRVRKIAGCYLFYVSQHHYFFVPIEAFEEADRPALEEMLRQKNLLR